MRARLGELLEGAAGWARQVSVPDHPFAAVNVVTWFLQVPGQSAEWDCYRLAVTTMDEALGVPGPVRYYAGAEFELTLAALNPRKGPVADDVETWSPLGPACVSFQFHGVSRAQAARVARKAARMCVAGLLPAETRAVERPDGGGPVVVYVPALWQRWQRVLDGAVNGERAGRRG